MNQTKKITTGAMMLAIVGAAMLIDRQFSYAFDVLISLVMPIIIIIYATKYTLTDGALLCVGLAVICFLFEGLTSTTFLYLPVTIITGLGYSYGLKKNLKKNFLLYIAVIVYMIGEVVTTFMIMPVFGLDISAEVAAIGEIAKEMFASSVSTINLTDNLLLLIFVVSMIVTGVMEGFLIHLLTCFLLKRFKIKEIESFNFLAQRPNPILGYVCLACTAIFFFVPKLENNQILFIILTSIAMVAVIVLFYSGYMFAIFYGRTIKNGKFNLILIAAVILLFPYSGFVLVVCGFLYLTGPFRDKLERKIASNENQQG